MAKKKSRKTPTQPPENCASSTPIENSMANLSLGGVSVNSTPQPRLTRGNIVQEFDHYFGNATKLENWRRLCHDVGVADDLPSITQCKQALKGIWVNIYDLINAVRTNSTPPRLFPNQKALATYTISNQKIYPKKKAKQGRPVRALLTHIF